MIVFNWLLIYLHEWVEILIVVNKVDPLIK